jgi:phage/plasmid primase-like uncharacterized protein
MLILGDQNAAKSGWPIFVTESYSTGKALQTLNGGLPVAIAFAANNLERVAVALRGEEPERTIYVACDNDHMKPKEKDANGNWKTNTGVVKGIAAASKVGGIALIPKFDKLPNAKRMTDWWDLSRADPAGKEASNQLAAGMAVGRARMNAAMMKRAPQREAPVKLPPQHQRERQLERAGHERGLGR